MTTLNVMVKRCSGMVGTDDLSDWEDDFLKSISEKTRDGEDTRGLSEKQIEVLTRIYNKHFSG